MLNEKLIETAINASQNQVFHKIKVHKIEFLLYEEKEIQ
jgi:hypothetical protein